MNGHDQTECRAVDDLLIAVSAGELEAELTAQLQAHLKICANCREAMATIRRAQQLAAEMKLASPELDRYPEFLRRLAANEAQEVEEAELITDSMKSTAQMASLATIREENELATGAATQAGVAAIIPLFGNRLVFRSGFGRGFDLQVTSKQNRELFHLSANSLVKAAAVVAGVGIFAATTLFALGFMGLLLFRQWQKAGSQNADQPIAKPEQVKPQGQFPDSGHAPPIPQNVPWVQTVAGENSTLALWKAGSQIQAGFIDHQNPFPNPVTLLTPGAFTNRPSHEPRITDCAIASDGQGYMVVREQQGNILAWNLSPRVESQLASRPIVLSEIGFQPAIAWAGDRYLAVWIEPDPALPKIRMIELGKDGRPLQASAMTVAESERETEKLGTPSIVAQTGKAMIVYQRQGGAILAKMWDSANGLDNSQFELFRQNGWMINRSVLSVAGNSYYLCLGENRPEGAELRVAKISFAGEVQQMQTLVVSRTQILMYDFRVFGENMAMIWSEAAPGGAQIFAQRFSLEGIPATSAIHATPSEIPPMAFAFADAEGKAMIWHEARPSEGRVPVAIRRIDWSK